AVDPDAEIGHELSLESANELIGRRSLGVARPAILLQGQCRIVRIDAHRSGDAACKINFIPLRDLVAILIVKVHVDVVGVTGSREENVSASELARIAIVRSAQKGPFLLAKSVGKADTRREIVPLQTANRSPRNR